MYVYHVYRQRECEREWNIENSLTAKLSSVSVVFLLFTAVLGISILSCIRLISSNSFCCAQCQFNCLDAAVAFGQQLRARLAERERESEGMSGRAKGTLSLPLYLSRSLSNCLQRLQTFRMPVCLWHLRLLLIPQMHISMLISNKTFHLYIFNADA